MGEMMDFIQYYIALLMICSPFVAIPTLLTLTQGQSLKEKRSTSIRSACSVAIILIGVTWVGAPFLRLLNIRVEAFQVSGGIIVFLLALSMLHARISPMKQTPEDKKEAMHKESVAVVPLAIPLMAGPGAISSVIVFVSEFPGVVERIYASICALLVAITLGIGLYFAASLEGILGVSGLNILSRVGGLILAAISVEILAKGLIALFPGLGL
ncbi:MAG: NAAT family transporter [Chlamydiae bacterium]|nr:NAAT family transporter [Chlamydiota bacterium]